MPSLTINRFPNGVQSIVARPNNPSQHAPSTLSAIAKSVVLFAVVMTLCTVNLPPTPLVLRVVLATMLPIAWVYSQRHRDAVEREVLVVPGLGVQLTECKGTQRRNDMIPWEDFDGVVINEAVCRCKVVFYLCALLKDGTVHLLFPDMDLLLDQQQTVFRLFAEFHRSQG